MKIIIYFVQISKVIHQPAQRGAEGPSHTVTLQWVPLSSAEDGHCLLQKWWLVVLKCWGEMGNSFPSFRASLFPQMVYCGCSERFILFFRGRAMLCSSLLPQLSSAESGEQEAPWNSPTSHSSPKPLGLHGRSRWFHSLEQEVCREASHGLSEQGHRRTK